MTKESIFSKSQPGQHAYSLPKSHLAFESFSPPPSLLRQEELSLPEISELDLTRHYSRLAHKNMGIDTHFYPLGSCTMKLNPRINEDCANLLGFKKTHPFADVELVQGNLRLIHELSEKLCEICGFSKASLNPCAGSQGEFVGIRMIAKYHQERKDFERKELLIPDNAHGTNPASASLAGFTTRVIPSNDAGDLDLTKLRALAGKKTAGLMLTNPNTLGLFSPQILEIAKIVHEAGGLLYYDGANLNPILNICRPGDMGFDVMHLNLHKTFSTPHGGGGPGSGPVLCNQRLEKYLPTPKVLKKDEQFSVQWQDESSIGQIASFFGNFGIYLRAYVYILLHGMLGLRKIAEMAILNANYLKKRLEKLFTIPFSEPCMHEFVVQADKYLDKNVKALDIAKRLLDYGYHAPTIYFPLIIKECMLIEPTESESKKTLDAFVEALEKIVEEIHQQPELLLKAPHNYSVSRFDEVKAVKEPILKHADFSFCPKK